MEFNFYENFSVLQEHFDLLGRILIHFLAELHDKNKIYIYIFHFHVCKDRKSVV